MAKFRVLRGIHSEKGADGVSRVYRKDEVVDSKTDLSKMNAPGMQPKFEKVEGGAKPSAGTAVPTAHPTAPASSAPVPATLREYHDRLDKMSVKELQDHAAEEEIDVRGAGNDKNKLLAILKKA